MPLLTSIICAEPTTRRNSLRQISHDLRNVLTVMNGNIDDIKSKNIPAIERPLNRLVTAAKRIEEIEKSVADLIKAE
jgi:K+-sensing histidine kinase KdpD